MHYKVLFAFVFVTYCSHYSGSLDIHDCGSFFTFGNVEVDKCDKNGETCPLYIGAMTKISFSLNTVTFNIDSGLYNDVGLYVRGGPKLSVLVTPEDPCTVLLCPLDANYNATYTAYIYVDPSYPPLSGIDLRWILATSAFEQLLCFDFPVTMQY